MNNKNIIKKQINKKLTQYQEYNKSPKERNRTVISKENLDDLNNKLEEIKNSLKDEKNEGEINKLKKELYKTNLKITTFISYQKEIENVKKETTSINESTKTEKTFTQIVIEEKNLTERTITEETKQPEIPQTLRKKIKKIFNAKSPQDATTKFFNLYNNLAEEKKNQTLDQIILLFLEKDSSSQKNHLELLTTILIELIIKEEKEFSLAQTLCKRILATQDSEIFKDFVTLFTKSSNSNNYKKNSNLKLFNNIIQQLFSFIIQENTSENNTNNLTSSIEELKNNQTEELSPENFGKEIADTCINLKDKKNQITTSAQTIISRCSQLPKEEMITVCTAISLEFTERGKLSLLSKIIAEILPIQSEKGLEDYNDITPCYLVPNLLKSLTKEDLTYCCKTIQKSLNYKDERWNHLTCLFLNAFGNELFKAFKDDISKLQESLKNYSKTNEYNETDEITTLITLSIKISSCLSGTPTGLIPKQERAIFGTEENIKIWKIIKA